MPHNWDKENQKNWQRFAYDNKMGQMFKFMLLNLGLNIITLGLYSFWSRVSIRKYIISRISLADDYLEYTGTGKEFLSGFLKILPIAILFYPAFLVWSSKGENLIMIVIAFLTLLLAWFLIYNAWYLSIRYKISKTSWREINIRLAGSAFIFAKLKIKRLIKNIITLGYSIPYSDVMLEQYFLNNLFIGSRRVDVKIYASNLILVNIVSLIFFLPTLGISRCWYRAKLLNLLISSAKIGDLRLSGNITAFELLKLNVGNVLILILTLGLASSLTMHRKIRYFTSIISVIGDVNEVADKKSAEQDELI